MGKALRLAETWNAIILIDEADVFLEQRTTNELVRNGLVSGLIPPKPIRKNLHGLTSF